MIARIQVRQVLSLSQCPAASIRMFEGRKMRKLHHALEDTHIDFTRAQPVAKYVEEAKKFVKKTVGFVPLSEAVEYPNKVPRALPAYVQLRPEDRRFVSRKVKKILNKKIAVASAYNEPKLRDKLF